MALLDHADQTGAPRDFTLDGKPYPVAGLTPYQLGQIEAYLKTAVPDPMAEVRDFLRGDDVFTAPERALLIAEARQRREPQYSPDGFQLSGWPPTFNSRQGQAILFNGLGIAEFLYVIISRLTPTFTREDAERLAPLLTVEKLTELGQLIQAKNPTPEDDEDKGDSSTSGPALRTDLPAGYVDPNG